MKLQRSTLIPADQSVIFYITLVVHKPPVKTMFRCYHSHITKIQLLYVCNEYCLTIG